MSAPSVGVSSASMSTFGGMYTEDDLSTIEARQRREEEAEEKGEEVDEIVQELPIYLSHPNEGQILYQVQSPLRPSHRPYQSDLGFLSSVKVKPVQKKMEFKYTIEDAGVNYQTDGGRLGDEAHEGHNYDREHQYQMKHVTLLGKAVPPKTNYCIGVLSNGALYLEPVQGNIVLRPTLGHVDEQNQAALLESEAKREAHRYERLREGRMTEEEELEMEEEEYQRVKEEENKKELQTVIMKVKKKEYNGGAAGLGSAATGGAAGGIPTGGTLRKQSYAFLKQIEEREEWIPLKVHDTDAPVTIAQFNKLLGQPGVEPQPIPFNVSAQHYLSYVNPPDVMEANSSSMALIAAGDPLYLSFEERILYFMRSCRVCQLNELCLKLQIVNDEQLETALRELVQICWIIQGCLVLKSSIVYDRNWRIGMAVPPATQAPSNGSSMTNLRQQRGLPDRIQLGREYLLTLFHQQRTIDIDEANRLLQLDGDIFVELLSELAIKHKIDSEDNLIKGVPTGGQWTWKLEKDTSLQR